MDKNRQRVRTRLSVVVLAIMLSSVQANATNAPKMADDKTPAEVVLYTPAQIQERLNIASQEKGLGEAPDDGFFVQNDALISRLDEAVVPLGLDINAVTKIPTPDTLTTLGIDESGEKLPTIDPANYIPEYQYVAQDDTVLADETSDVIARPNFAKRVFNRLFNDGVEQVVRLDVEFYEHVGADDKKITKIKTSELKKEPYANIKAALEDVTAESVTDFNGAMPRLRQSVKSAAQAVGYYDLNFVIAKAGAGKVHVIINDVGEPVRVANQALQVRGDGADNPAYQEAIVQAKLAPNGVFHHGNYESAKGAIADVSMEQGFFDGRWLDNSVDVILPDNTADVSLVYDTGVQYTFDDVVFFTYDEQTGKLTTDPSKLPVKEELLKKLVSFDMGDAYNRNATRNLSNNLLATGYFNAVNTETILPNPNPVQTDVAFENTAQKPQETIQESAQDEQADVANQVIDLGDGVSATVAPIEFSTSQVIQDKVAMVVQKAEQLYAMPDDRLLVTDTRKKSRSLLGRVSDAISSVAKVILPDETDDLAVVQGELPTLEGRKTAQEVYQDKKVPLYVFVMTDKPRDAQIGLGWGSDTGTRLITKFEHHLINRSGYQAGADVRWSQDKKGVSLYATRPLSHPLNDKLRASLSYDEEFIDGSSGAFNLYTRTLQQGLSRNIVKDSGWHTSYSLRYRLDELESRTPVAVWGDLPVRFIDGKPTQEALLAGMAFSKTVFDNPVNPMRGYRHNYSLEAGSKKLISDTDMAIVRAGFGGIYSFGDNAYGKNRAHQLIGSLNTGYIWAKDFNTVPYKLRFFAGGDQSIRGYNYDSLSPLSDKGYLTGGQILAVASGEYNYEVLEGLRVAMFADVGNAYDEQFSNPTKIGAGVGLRYASPVGQVRVDVATGVKEKDKSIKLHFFIGTPF